MKKDLFSNLIARKWGEKWNQVISLFLVFTMILSLAMPIGSAKANSIDYTELDVLSETTQNVVSGGAVVPVVTAASEGAVKLPKGSMDPYIIQINPTLIDKDFSQPGSVTLNGSVASIDSKIMGTIGYDGTTRDVTDEGGSLNLKAISNVCNSYKSGISMPKELGMYTKVKFNNTSSERNLFQIGKVLGSTTYDTLLKFKSDGSITDNSNTIVGSYDADTWYEITVFVNFYDSVYKLWMDDVLIIDNKTINSGFDGVGMIHKLEQRNISSEESVMSIAKFQAGTVIKPQIPFNDMIKGTLTNKNFMKDTLAETSATRRTIDTAFLGYCDFTSGENSIEIVDMPSNDTVKKALKLNANSKNINSYKGSAKHLGRWGIETKIKFNNTISQRVLFEFKNVPGNKFSNLLTFNNSGKIIDCNNTEIGTYNAEEWYTLQIVMDTDKRSYGVWLNGTMLNDDIRLADPLWDGKQFNVKMHQMSSSAGVDDITYVAYIKAGEIVPKAGDITADDITLKLWEGRVIQAKADKEGAFIGTQVCTSSDPTVVKAYGNGLLAVGEGSATVTIDVPETGQTADFLVTVTDKTMWETNPNLEDDLLLAVLQSAHRADVTTKTEQQLLSDYPKLTEYMNLSEADFITAVEKASSDISTRYKQTEFQSLTRIMIGMYRLDKVNNLEYAKRAALIMYYQAKDYPRIAPLTGGNSFKGSDEVFPSSAVYAYGILAKDNVMVGSDTIWEYVAKTDIANDSTLTGKNVVEVVEELWFRPAAFLSMEFIFTKPAEPYGGILQQLNNIDVYGARSTAVTANLINDPDLVRYVVLFYDKLLSGGYWTYDGMWFEGSSQYSDQVTGNVQLGTNALVNYRDPVGYVWTDPKKYEAEYDLKFNLEPTDCHISDLVFNDEITAETFAVRWPLNKLSENIAAEKMVYPNGKPIPINDSYSLADFDQPLSNVNPNKLENIEFPGFGYYGLVQGDDSNATHIGLLNQGVQIGFSGGHTHTSFLAISLWSAGADLLSDIGYVVAGNGNYADGNKHTRFPAMKPRFHNMPWIWMKDKSNEKSTGEYTKPAVLAYDDGSSNGNKIEVVELEKGEFGKTKRLNMLVQLDNNRSYILDLSRLSGGDAHEIYLRGSDTENMSVETSGITFTDTGKANLKDYLTEQGKTEGFDIDREYMQIPKAANGNSDFSMKWTGAKSGSAVTTWINGVENSDLYLSELPRSREVASKAEELEKTAPHLSRFRLTDGTDKDITQYGALYEPTKSGETNLIKDVKWTTDSEGAYIAAEVTTDSFKDVIYISNDNVKRNIGGIAFTGSLAVVRVNNASQKKEFVYLYGDSKVNSIISEKYSYKIVDSTSKSINGVIDPDLTKTSTLTVEGIVPEMNSYTGKWIQIQFGDKSGLALKVKKMEQDESNTKITVEQYMPFKLTSTGVKTTFFPNEDISGDAYAIFALGKFKDIITDEDDMDIDEGAGDEDTGDDETGGDSEKPDDSTTGGGNNSGGSGNIKPEVKPEEKPSEKPKDTVEEIKPVVINSKTPSKSTYNKVRISWNKSENSDGYEIYRSTSKNGPFKKVGEITNGDETEFLDKNLVTGKTYYYRIRNYRMEDGKKVLGKDFATVKSTTAIQKPEIKTVRNNRSSAVITWGKVQGATGYEVYRSTSKKSKYSKVATTKKPASTSFQDSKLKKDKTYYYKIRAYRVVNNKKVYSTFSVPVTLD